MPEISVTVPVYNVEQYLRRCLDTVLDQTFNLDYEIICVDDGSTDSSPQILAEYDKKYPGKFKIIHQENKGLSEARNTAMKYVTGKYTMFVDSDDFIAKNTLEKLYEYAQAHNSEVVNFDFLRGEKGQPSFRRQHYEDIALKYGDRTFNAKTGEEFIYRLIWGGSWSRLYLTDLIKDIKFETGLINQDVCHWIEVFTRAKRINYYPVPFYCYVMNRENAITTDKSEKVFDVFKVFSIAENTLRRTNYFDKYKNLHYIVFAEYLVFCLRKIYPDIRRKFIEKIKNYDIDLDYESIKKGNYNKVEKNELLLIKDIRENSFEKIEELCKIRNIWTD